MGKAAAGFSQQTMELLQSYAWPGNVRELQNEVQRLVIQIEPGAFVTPDMLSPRVRQIEGMIERVPARARDAEGDDGPGRALAAHRGACASTTTTRPPRRAALGITREGLHKKLRGFGL